MVPNPAEEVPAHKAAAVLLLGSERGIAKKPLYYNRRPVGGEQEAEKQPGDF